ncbi:MAG: hypothetical protein ACE5HZ_09050, partial [Fidelibacterota bacterium]
MNTSPIISAVALTTLLAVFPAQSSGADDTFQTTSARDTVFVQMGDSVLVLSHTFVIDGTERVMAGGIVVTSYRLQSIPGKIILEEPARSDSAYSISYRYLSTPFPVRTDPLLASLPRLHGDSSSHELPPNLPQVSRGSTVPLVANGTIFRGISLSPSTGMSLDGGLRLSLQGRVSDDMTVSGTLSDQNSPISPGGDTQTLSEIDKVYLEVNHPRARVQAGDLDMNLPIGQFLNVTRRLEGLHVSSGSAGGGMEGYLGGTGGRFRRQEFRGEDGNQGPYPLLSESGQENVRVMAGSEKVWVDGERMYRGENRDYVIDYARGEISFTPKRLMDSNRRVAVEFEYSDLSYRRNVASLAFHRSLVDERARVSVGWVREQDDLKSQLPLGLGDEERRVLGQSGDGLAKIVTASRDSAGDYVRRPGPDSSSDSVFVYVVPEERMGMEPLYRISFHNLGSDGEYTRKIAPDGSVIFEYVPEAKRTSGADLYVPWRPLPSPESHQMVNMVTEVTLFDSTRVVMELAGSQRDRNLISDWDDGNNLGAAGSVEFLHTQVLPGRAGSLALEVNSSRLDERFSALQRTREVEFDREWNLTEGEKSRNAVEKSDRSVHTLEVRHRIGERVNTELSYGTYGDSRQNSRRWYGSTTFSSHWMPHVSLDFTRSGRSPRGTDFEVEESVWTRGRFGATFLPGPFHPYLRYDEEERTGEFRFQESSGGLQARGDRVNARAGVTHRLDFTP